MTIRTLSMSMNTGEKEFLRLRSGRKVVAEKMPGRDACPTNMIKFKAVRKSLISH
jgi:hypothetical protein